MKRGATAAMLLLAAAGAAFGAYRYARRGGDEFPRPPGDAHAPAGVRIKVEVLNASTVRGLARRATLQLRDRGFDVVSSGTSAERRDTTLVLDRTHHPTWAALAARAMGGAAVEVRPDTLRDVDLTVLVGGSWRPPPEPFYP